ncbi:MAG TPA: type II secretion system protein N [Allosphingosinicella sp.]|nr:type II secretion system protein N [Allosphingosinicella sp.]
MGHIDRYPGLYLPHAAGIVLAALMAYQCATLYSVIVTPLDGRPEQADLPPKLQPAAPLGSFDPFFTAALAGTAPVAPVGLTLHGLRQDGRTGGGSAIISQSDGAQRSVGVGEEIAPGLILKQVGSDHAIVIRNGMDERLAFEAFGSTGPAATPTAGAIRSPLTLATSPPPAVEVRRTTPRMRGLPPRKVDFADPSTIPESLKTPQR